MSDDVTIRSGGAIAVDTSSLEAAARGFALVAARLDEVSDEIAVIARDLQGVAFAEDAAFRAAAHRGMVMACSDGADALASRLREVAGVYEIVELRAASAAAEAAGDALAVARTQALLAFARAGDPDAARRADTFEEIWRAGASAEFGVQALLLAGMIGPAASAGAVTALPLARAVVTTIGGSRIPAGASLEGGPQPALVSLVPVGTASTAPVSLADAAVRMPGADATRIRVERYTMADGSRQFAVYIAGTQSPRAFGRDPFDMGSNAQLYTGVRSSSYDATLSALRRAGAEPGDVVHAFGHSQGGMVASWLAVSDDYDTRTLVTFGSPVAADVGDATLSVSVRHSDDPVVALADGGFPGSVGAPGSFVAERVADPVPRIGDLLVPSHQMTAYAETAAMLDASSDPRMDAVRDVFDELGTAASVDITAWSAERPVAGEVSGPSSAGGG